MKISNSLPIFGFVFYTVTCSPKLGTMRFSLILIIGVLFGTMLNAQVSVHKATEIKFYTQKFSLSKAQVTKLFSVIERKYVTYETIQRYKGTERYASKLKALYEGTVNSIQLLLKTSEQKEAFRQYRMALRSQKAEVINKYRKKGKQLKAAEYEYYLEVFFPKG